MRDQKTKGASGSAEHLALCKKVQEHLLSGAPLSRAVWEPKEKALVDELTLLTAKPVIYVCNVDEAGALSGNALTEKVQTELQRIGSDGTFSCAIMYGMSLTVGMSHHGVTWFSCFVAISKGLDCLGPTRRRSRRL
jgi:ribosome-binding ATPase YchF (GTP1/OBG family)